MSSYFTTHKYRAITALKSRKNTEYCENPEPFTERNKLGEGSEWEDTGARTCLW